MVGLAMRFGLLGASLVMCRGGKRSTMESSSCPIFLPRRGDELVRWTQNFDQLINADAEMYSLTPAQAAQYSVISAAFIQAFQIANSNDTRTPTSIIVKDQAEQRLRGYTRELAAIVRADKSVGDAQLVALGLNPRRVSGPRVPRPASVPRVSVGNPVGRTVPLLLRDAESPSSKARPRGVSGAAIFTFVGEEQPASIDDWEFHDNVTRTNVKITFRENLPPGTKVWITAQWYSPTGKRGPGASPVCTHLGYATVVGGSVA